MEERAIQIQHGCCNHEHTITTEAFVKLGYSIFRMDRKGGHKHQHFLKEILTVCGCGRRDITFFNGISVEGLVRKIRKYILKQEYSWQDS